MPSQGQTLFWKFGKNQHNCRHQAVVPCRGAAWWGTHPVPFLPSSPGPPWASLWCQSFSDSIELPQESPIPMPLFWSQVAKLDAGSPPSGRHTRCTFLRRLVPPICQLTCPQCKVSRGLSPNPFQTGFVKGR